MRAGTSLYRTLTRLYPRAFRAHFGDDLVVHFRDLVARDGAATAWRRTAIDLVLTVPRYRLESIMHTRRTTTALAAVIAALAVAAFGAFAGLVPVAVVALGLAAAIGIVARRHLVGVLRPDGSGHRRRMRRRGALLGGCCAASLAIGLVDLGGRDRWPAGRLLAYNATFLTTGIAAVACLVVGLRRGNVHAPGVAGAQHTG
jgi:hypothetical protein